MAKYQINLVKEPNIALSCNLEDDNGNTWAVDIALRTLKDGKVCINIDIDAEPQIYGELVNDRMPLVPTNILGGNIYFEDKYGNDNPNYAEYNDRFILVYDTEFKLG